MAISAFNPGMCFMVQWFNACLLCYCITVLNTATRLMTDSLKTFSDLFIYAKSQARIEFVDYAGGRDSVYYWRQDKSRRDNDRKKVMARYGWLADQALPVGQSGNGRLMVTADSVDYCAGQYPPTEVWGAVFDYIQINYR